MAILSKVQSLFQNSSAFCNLVNYSPKNVLYSSNPKWTGLTLHVTSQNAYPVTKPLPLPGNVEDINSAEKCRFSPERNRDISGSFLTSVNKSFTNGKPSDVADPHVKSYDCTGAVSLNSSMQTNVPQPFYTDEDLTNLNMPGGQWGQGHKYMSEELNQSHPLNISRPQTNGATTELRNFHRKSTSFVLASSQHDIGHNLLQPAYNMMGQNAFYSTNKPEGELSRKDKLKKAVKEYGATVIVFHISISLVSLGGFYLAVTSGIDFTKVLGQWGATEGAKAAESAAPFVVAYAIHKLFAPVRISITLASTPFIVRYLRRVGFLKPPIPK